MNINTQHSGNRILVNKQNRRKACGLLFGCLAIGIGTGLGLITNEYGSEKEKAHAGLIGFLGFYFVSMTGVFLYFVKKTSRRCNNSVQDTPQVTPRESNAPEFTDMNHERAWEQEEQRVQKIVEIVKLHSSSSGSDTH